MPTTTTKMKKAVEGDGNEGRHLTTSTPSPSSTTSLRFNLFEIMTTPKFIWIFLCTLPIVWIVFVAIGWSKEDKVEDSVYNIWTRQRSDYNKDLDYVTNIIGKDGINQRLGATSFAALAVSRDNTNLFVPSRLEEIRTRMEETESTTIEYKGETYTWDDVCAKNDVGLGTTYKFPCIRLSPMDFFQEADWFFDSDDKLTWYQEVVRKLIIAPRIPRFGILQKTCSNLTEPFSGRTDCDSVIVKRMMEGNPMLLFADIGNLENNHVCKRCIEEEYENTITFLHTTITGLFKVMMVELNKAGEFDLVAKYTTLLEEQLDRQAVIDFYTYYVIRGLYVSLGATAYMENNDLFLGTMCQMQGTPCPPSTTLAQAQQALAQHADHTFSSTVTSGNPLPYWGDDGEGYLMQPGQDGQLYPVGGSGIDLSGTLFSSTAYFDLANYMSDAWTPNYREVGGTASSSDPAWTALVESDPVYKWFMSGVTEMTAHCGNGFLKGTNLGVPAADQLSSSMMQGATQMWCTPYNMPFETSETRTQQHFARMWYDLLVDSPSFLNLVQGQSTPYTWTTGQGCGYHLGGSRVAYNDVVANSTSGLDDLYEATRGELYYVDEGESIGAIDKHLLIGGSLSGDDGPGNTVIQTIYPAAIPQDIVERVQNCNRPQGSIEISLKDAEEVLYRFKEKFEETWTKGWDDDSQGDVQFVGFFDDTGVIGTTGRMLKDITLSNGLLVAVSIIIIAVFSVLFVFQVDVVESRIMITLLGVGLVILAFFAAVGFALMVGIKINITIAWTLPFIILGLGVDDMYIVLLALRKQQGYEQRDFLEAMKEVFVPITMTSVVNAGMFAIMNINDIPAVYLTAQVALISVIFLYLTVVFCFAGWCYLDMRRQAQGRFDILCCIKKEETDRDGHDHQEPPRHEKGKLWASAIYDKFYKPLVLDTTSNPIRVVYTHIFVWLAAAALLAFGIWGLTADQREIGLGLEDFFPEDNQAGRWATLRTEELASWSIQMNWGNVDYTDPNNQMRVIKQFEDVVSTNHVAEVDTKRLWLADFVVWSSYQCTANFDRLDADVLECGYNQVWPGDNSTCTGTWKPNVFGLREKVIPDDLNTCVAFEKGICRPIQQMHPMDLNNSGVSDNSSEDYVLCPVIDGWTNDKWQYCVSKWREITNGGSGRLILEDGEIGTPYAECDGERLADETVRVPILYASSPTIYAYDLFTHEITIDMIEETRAICDNDPNIHCFMTGIPYDYWTQYIDIYNTFWEIGGTAVASGFVISWLFLLFKFLISEQESHHSMDKVVVGSLVGALLISVTTILSLVTVSGLSALFDVSFTGFSTMSFVLSVGFAVEYSVHVVARWLRAPQHLTMSMDRVEYTMSFLTLPTFMAFVSSTIGVACLAFTAFEFNKVFFFRPLIIVMFVTYFYGCWWLPVCLSLLDFDHVQLGTTVVETVVSATGKEVEGHHHDDSEEVDEV